MQGESCFLDKKVGDDMSRNAVFFKKSAIFLLMMYSVVAYLPRTSYSADVKLAWQPNGEADLEGYGVYFNKDTPSLPYSFFGYVSVSELSKPEAPSVTVTGLEPKANYFFAVTAYDTEGWESAFSNVICVYVDQELSQCTYQDKPESRGSGGGGGGCFVNSSRYDLNTSD